MKSNPMWRRYLRFLGANIPADVDDELHFHIEMRTRDLITRGMDPKTARTEAVRRFGGMERVRRECEEVDHEIARQKGRREWWDGIRQDVRFALRSLRKRPGFTLAALLTLALGIGANTAIFSVVDAVLLRPLPFRDANRLVALWESDPAHGPEISTVAFPVFQDWVEQSRAFERLGAYSMARHSITGGQEPVQTNALAITSSLLPTLGVTPFLGRGFVPEDDVPGGAKRVLLGYGFWRRNFGADRSIVGRTVELDGTPFEVVGVLPEGFEFPPAIRAQQRWVSWAPEVYVPVAGVGGALNIRGARQFFVVGRLAPGVSMEQVQEEMSTLAAQLRHEHGATSEKETMHVAALQELVVGPLRPAILAFTGAVGLVLLIACVNLGSLLLARLSARDREIGLRAAIGANRQRLVRQLLTESIVLALLGGGMGVLLAWGGLQLFLRAAPTDLPRLGEATLNARALGFALTVSLASGLLFGLLPAFRASRADLRSLLNAGGRGIATERSTRRTHGVLVTVEVALAVALLVGAGLLIRSFGELTKVDPGFRMENLLTLDLRIPPDRYPELAQVLGFYDEVEDRFSALPGVRSVSAIDRLPFGQSDSRTSFDVVGRPRILFGAEQNALNTTARPGYFQTMGIPVLAGRTFDERDRPDAPSVVVISQSLAQRFWPDGSPLGERIRTFGREWEIAGVVGDVRHYGPAMPPEPMIYFPHAQDVVARRGMTLVVRTAGNPREIIGAVREQVRVVDPQLPVSKLQTFGALRSAKLSAERFNALLVGTFAALALALAAVGIGGVMSFTVARQTREIGVRMALGASSSTVLAMVLRRAGILVGLGMMVGLGLAVPLTRWMKSLLFGIAPGDLLTFGVAAGLLALVGLVAAWLPARRAARVDPMAALRYE